MKARVKWVEDITFVGEADSGHAVVMDAAVENGGNNRGMRPMEMLLVGMGGCTAFDVLLILKKARQPVTDCEVLVDAERATDHPTVFTRIRVHYRIRGKGLAEAHVKRAVDLSAHKYCSASMMLGKTAEMSHDYEILED